MIEGFKLSETKSFKFQDIISTECIFDFITYFTRYRDLGVGISRDLASQLRQAINLYP